VKERKKTVARGLRLYSKEKEEKEKKRKTKRMKKYLQIEVKETKNSCTYNARDRRLENFFFCDERRE